MGEHVLTVAIAAAALLAGLYIGERGRRKDRDTLLGVRRGGKPQPATARYIPDAEAEAIMAFTQEERERLIEDIMRMNPRASRGDAEAEAERLMQIASRMGSEGL